MMNFIYVRKSRFLPRINKILGVSLRAGQCLGAKAAAWQTISYVLPQHFNKPLKDLLEMKKFSCFLNDDSGATAIEYALIASAMALALVAAMPALGTIIKDKFSSIGGSITSGS
jgi:pilus assembly protein Flp/PilA